ncbi:hypothetical protein Tco_0822273 [Tanacetum coccineum]|uniref:Uncharacterized protein n=1 Tax=Tanacetum coccineum TaxID=301880 RepID=A0ABQ5AJG2_9ASTR
MNIAVKLCLEHEVKRGNNVVTNNPEEDDVEPGSSGNKKRVMENLNFFHQDIGTSSLAGGHLTQEEASKEAITIRMRRKFALLEEERPILETMAYHDKYKKILDEVWKDKAELDGKIIKGEEEATGQWRTEIRLTDPYGNI